MSMSARWSGFIICQVSLADEQGQKEGQGCTS